MTLGNLTLNEIKKYCQSQENCDTCLFHKPISVGTTCYFERMPHTWTLEEEEHITND